MDFSTDPNASPRHEVQLQGSRPTPLKAPPTPLPPWASSLSPGLAGPLSPSACFATIERGYPPPNPHKPPPHASVEDMEDLVGISAALDMGNLPGILLSFLSALPRISPSYFSLPLSASDLGSLAFLNEMSPMFWGAGGPG
ncbi:hypothetical protein Taro_012821 [Colocasia esculenta]|uniref:Uncharacterized protein n=1 Tax=Colocasia esculenta TaxID=4460 RepID=A0A843UEM1_COLES|nr:hypothetical protein [Colocasia esculenta]